MKCPTCGGEFEAIRVHWSSSSTCEIPESEYHECSFDGCEETFRLSRGLDTHELHHPKHNDGDGRICLDCGHRYDRISAHWSSSDSCSYPEMTERHHEIVRGLLMGDGTARGGSSTSTQIKVRCIVPSYLQHLSDEFGILGGSVSLGRTAAEGAANNRKRGFSPDAKAENYSDIYRFQTKSHPDMSQYSDWYSTGEKVWPEKLELSPATLTHWYCGDGNNQSDYPSIRLSMSNERDNKKKVERYFNRAGLPTPDRWDDGGEGRHCNACWRKDTSLELFDYMEGPVVGYEYKWPHI